MKKLLLASVALIAAGTANAADLRAPAPYYKAPLAPSFSWSGFYVGANVGYGFDFDDPTNLSTVGSTTGDVFHPNPTPSTVLAHAISTANASAVPGSIKTDPHGVIGGGQIGYNWQSGWWVYGVETDFQGSAIKDSAKQGGSGVGNIPFGPFTIPVLTSASAAASEQIDWFGTLRARIGFTPFDPHFLVYGTGGLAYGQVQASSSYSLTGCILVVCAPSSFASTVLGTSGPSVASGSATSTRAGWAAGAGMEYAFWSNWSVKTEWIHYDLGSLSYAMSPSVFTFPAIFGPGNHSAIASTTATAHFAGDIVRIGVNYKFW